MIHYNYYDYKECEKCFCFLDSEVYYYVVNMERVYTAVWVFP